MMVGPCWVCYGWVRAECAMTMTEYHTMELVSNTLTFTHLLLTALWPKSGFEAVQHRPRRAFILVSLCSQRLSGRQGANPEICVPLSWCW